MKESEKSRAEEILNLYLQNKYSPETEDKIQKWLIENPDVDNKEQAILGFWDSINASNSKSTLKALKRVNTKIKVRRSPSKVLSIKTFSRVAAVFVLLLGLAGIWFHFNKTENITVRSEFGEMREITLPDNSVVWLNAGSVLEYPSRFSKKNRLVFLTGEAFFSVTKNRTKPFVVETAALSVKVLGTRFNLKAYPEEGQTIATLQEGKIEILTTKKQTRQLEPNDQLIYDTKTSSLKVFKISADEIPDWKDGNIIFSNVSFDEILLTLSRHFNISFNVDQAIVQTSDRYTIKFEHDENLKQILGILEDVVGGFSYHEENGLVVITKNNTN